MRIKKAQTGKNVPKGYVKGEMTGRLISEKEDKAHRANMAKAMNEAKMSDSAFAKYKAKQDSMKKAPVKKKMKSGGKSFPDLTGDGKVTKADILKGRGVIKHGGKVKMKKGGAMKKCKYGC